MDRGQTFHVVKLPPSERNDCPCSKCFKEREFYDDSGTYKVLELIYEDPEDDTSRVYLILERENYSIFFVCVPPSFVREMKKEKCTNFCLNIKVERSEEKIFEKYTLKRCKKHLKIEFYLHIIKYDRRFPLDYFSRE